MEKEYIIQSSTLTAIADAIRAMGNISSSLTPLEMANAIENLKLPELGTAAGPQQILEGFQAYNKDREVVTGTLTITDLAGGATATPEDILLNKTAYTSAGLITGTLDVNYCYVSNSEPSAEEGLDGDLWVVTEA